VSEGSDRRMTFTRLKTLSLLVCALLALSFPGYVNGATNNNSKKGSQPVAPIEPEAVIEEVNAKQLEKLLADKDYVAVFWCKFRFRFRFHGSIPFPCHHEWRPGIVLFFYYRPTGLEIVTEAEAEAILYKFSLVKILKIHIQMKICEKFVCSKCPRFSFG